MAENRGTQISRRDLVRVTGAGALVAMVGADAIISWRADATSAKTKAIKAGSQTQLPGLDSR